MDDLADKLMELLSNKENLENIKSLSSLINASVENSTAKSEEKVVENSTKAPAEESSGETLPIDTIQTVMKLMPVLSSINKEDDNTRLLTALRPHLSSKRQAKLDESMKMIQVFKVLPMLKSQGIFSFCCTVKNNSPCQKTLLVALSCSNKFNWGK